MYKYKITADRAIGITSTRCTNRSNFIFAFSINVMLQGRRAVSTSVERNTELFHIDHYNF